jgi:thiamine-phosphate pyrophosphorylase
MPRPDLRLIVITDAQLAAPRNVMDVVADALAAGAPAIQLRDKRATARELVEQARALRALTSQHQALLFINDRLDVALAAGADGVHLGPDDLPLAAARAAVPTDFLIGVSTDDPQLAAQAERDGASYIGCGAVFGTTSKAEVAGEAIGPAALRAVVETVSIPVVGIGGIDSTNVTEIAAAGAAGCAVIGAIMKSTDIAHTVRSLLNPFPR